MRMHLGIHRPACIVQGTVEVNVCVLMMMVTYY